MRTHDKPPPPAEGGQAKHGGAEKAGSGIGPDGIPDGLDITLRLDMGLPLPRLTAAVTEVCDRAEERSERTVVIVRLPRAAAAARSWPGPVDIQQINRWERAVRRLERLPAMSIAVAGGACGGPALDLLLVSDYRIGAPDLRLLAPVNEGHFWPGMAVYRLSQQLGAARARQIVLWGDDIDASRAHELGLIDQVSADTDEAVHTASVLMGRISDRELAVRRQLLLEAQTLEFDDALGAHLAACDRELRRLTALQADPAPGGGA
ncbi:enoyl-CoA hydratase/isomerase family protein [Streptomyces sp. NBC_01433]|uniref:enoyl-CoA-hydratase DpgB n=1 Tax=Streptomyces sp. NBC_01433 TaxID=2903864 RepID=UPI00224E5714|nr:enoyl-CoA-hydratase DpgB [Streptomyces sp. NBC_01433]MCX4681205.1 enoyl-CoA hydratase/isomerase family protein [Streptomyces sp. NBC_01433]